MRRERVAGSRRGWRTGVALVVVAAFVAIGAPPPAGAAPAGTVVNTGRSGWEVQQVAGDLVVFTTSEFREQADLNGDGDTSDSVPVVWDRATGVTTTLPFAVYAFSTPPNGPPNFDADDQVVAFAVNESAQGATDLNGDGDAGDKVVHVWQRTTGTTTNLALAVSDDDFPAVAAGAVMLAVDEPTQGATDLNGDGDAFDDIVHIWTASGGVTNLGQEYFGSSGEVFSGRWVGSATRIDPSQQRRSATAVVYDSATGTTASSLATNARPCPGAGRSCGANERSNRRRSQRRRRQERLRRPCVGRHRQPRREPRADASRHQHGSTPEVPACSCSAHRRLPRPETSTATATPPTWWPTCGAPPPAWSTWAWSGRASCSAGASRGRSAGAAWWRSSCPSHNRAAPTSTATATPATRCCMRGAPQRGWSTPPPPARSSVPTPSAAASPPGG